MQDIDIQIIGLYRQGLTVTGIYREKIAYGLTLREIAKVITNSQVTMQFIEGEEDGYFIVPSMINYEFRLGHKYEKHEKIYNSKRKMERRKSI